MQEPGSRAERMAPTSEASASDNIGGHRRRRRVREQDREHKAIVGGAVAEE